MTFVKESRTGLPTDVLPASAPLVEFQRADMKELANRGMLVYPLTGDVIVTIVERSHRLRPELRACLPLLQGPARNCQVAIGMNTWPDPAMRDITHQQALDRIWQRSQPLPGTARTMQVAIPTLVDCLELDLLHMHETGRNLFQQGVEVRTATTDGDEVIGLMYDSRGLLQITRSSSTRTSLETPVFLLPSMA